MRTDQPDRDGSPVRSFINKFAAAALARLAVELLLKLAEAFGLS